MDRLLRFAAAAPIGPAFVAVLVALSGSAALAQSPAKPGYRALWPLPKAALQPMEPVDAAAGAPTADDIAAIAAADPEADADAALFAPLRMPQPVQSSGAGTVGIRQPMPVGVIRQGLPSQGVTGPTRSQRAVGLKLGADTFAVSAKVVAPADGASSDARLDWRLAHPASSHEPGFIWTLATGGSSGIASHPEQNADLMVGYRQPVFAYLTLTSQLTMQGNYVFAPGDGAHSAIVPEVKVSTDLNALAELPFDASFDLGLARQMPVVASRQETRGSAMLRVKYSFN